MFKFLLLNWNSVRLQELPLVIFIVVPYFEHFHKLNFHHI